MSEIFSNLLVSSPNNGGLLLVNANQVFKLDSTDTTGLHAAPNAFLRALQPDALWLWQGQTKEISDPLHPFRDIHDVLCFGDHYYIVGTIDNEVIKLDKQGNEIQRWSFPGETDSLHLNCLGSWNDRIVFSAFGNFTRSREYKGRSLGAGYVRDLLTGELLIENLSQPHSLVTAGENLLVANSEEMELREYSPAGQLLRSKKLGGYTRGICVSEDFVYVGLSKSRNVDDKSLETAVLLALHRDSWEEAARIDVPVDEIYSVVAINDAAALVNILAAGAAYASRRRDDRIVEQQQQRAELEYQSGLLEHTVHKLEEDNFRREQVLTHRDRQLDEQNGQIVQLNGQIAQQNGQIVQQNGRIVQLNSRLDEQNSQIDALTAQLAALHETLSVRDQQLHHLHQELRDTDATRARLEFAMAATHGSTSWRITAPLRQISTVLARLRGPYSIDGRAFELARGIYRALPLPASLRHRLRFAVLARSGLFSANGGWADGEDNNRFDDTPEADDEYTRFKYRIEKSALAAQVNWIPRQEPLVDLSGKDQRAFAATLSFAAPAKPQVSILLPVYGNAAITLECLASIKAATVAASYEIIVADDASPDQTAQLLESISGIKVHRNATNLGFLRNCNAALSAAQGEYVVYLNNDVQVKDGWLDGLLEVFSRHPDAGAAGPRIVYPSGHLQEAGVALKVDATADMVGLNDDPAAPRYAYERAVDYCSGACLMVRRDLLVELGGFSDEFAPAYCEDADLCLRIIERGKKIYYTPDSTIVHHLSKTMAADGNEKKLQQISTNLVKLHRKWAPTLDRLSSVKVIAFYLPQFHPIPENDLWWGEGFTEWVNVLKAKPNFVGHQQPRIPADLGYYDLRDDNVMVAQAELARKYGVDGFCFYYYWFAGKRLLEMPVERMLLTGKPDFPYCLCWANENWSRRWDGKDSEILIGQQHSPDDDRAVILDLIRHFRSPCYIRVDGRPHLIVYRVDLFPDFLSTARLWREICREEGVGEIYISMVESHDLVHKQIHPATFGCDAAIEFPPLNMATPVEQSGEIINPDYNGTVGDYRDTALRYCTRPLPGYTRFRGAMPGWDNTARRQHNGFAFEHSSPEVFQAWLEHIIRQTRQQRHGDEKMVFINAWNEWAEGAYLEPDTTHGHAFLHAVRNAKDAERLINVNPIDGESSRAGSA